MTNKEFQDLVVIDIINDIKEYCTAQGTIDQDLVNTQFYYKLTSLYKANKLGPKSRATKMYKSWTPHPKLYNINYINDIRESTNIT